jgi:hypothetical protein
MLDEVAAKLKTTFSCSRNRCVRTRAKATLARSSEIAKANPEVTIGSYLFFNPQHWPNMNVVLCARDVQTLARAKRNRAAFEPTSPGENRGSSFLGSAIERHLSQPLPAKKGVRVS